MLRSSSCCVEMVVCSIVPTCKRRNYDVKQAVVRLKTGGYNHFYYDSSVVISNMLAGSEVLSASYIKILGHIFSFSVHLIGLARSDICSLREFT